MVGWAWDQLAMPSSPLKSHFLIPSEPNEITNDGDAAGRHGTFL